MKLTTLQENLHAALSRVAPAVATRPTLPVTACALLEAQDSVLTLTGTNLEQTIITECGCMLEAPGAIAVPHRLLMDLIGGWPSDSVSLTLEGSVLKLECAGNRAEIHGVEAREFPPRPRMPEEAVASVDPAILRYAISRVAVAAAKEESRPILTGIELTTEGHRFTLAAADGFRLAVQDGELLTAPETALSVVIPARAMTELGKLLQAAEAPVDVALTPSDVAFRVGSTELHSQLLQGQFPSYSQLIPKAHDTRVVFDVAPLLAAVRTAQLFAKDSSDIVRIQVNEDGATVTGRSEDRGNADGHLELVELQGSGKIAFNSALLVDMLGCFKAEGRVALEMTTPSTPGVWKPVTGNGYVHVIMPMFTAWEG